MTVFRDLPDLTRLAIQRGGWLTSLPLTDPSEHGAFTATRDDPTRAEEAAMREHEQERAA